MTLHDELSDKRERVNFGGDVLSDGEKIALALCEVAAAIRFAANHLGTADATTPMGAIELLSSEVRRLADGLVEKLGHIDEQLGDIDISIAQRVE